MEDYYLDMININNFIYPMSDKEFYDFITTDKYGNKSVDKPSCEILLKLILNNKNFSDKETILLNLLKLYDRL